MQAFVEHREFPKSSISLLMGSIEAGTRRAHSSLLRIAVHVDLPRTQRRQIQTAAPEDLLQNLLRNLSVDECDKSQNLWRPSFSRVASKRDLFARIYNQPTFELQRAVTQAATCSAAAPQALGAA